MRRLYQSALTHRKGRSSGLARAFAGHKTFLSSFVYCRLRKTLLMGDLPRAAKPGKLTLSGLEVISATLSLGIIPLIESYGHKSP